MKAEENKIFFVMMWKKEKRRKKGFGSEREREKKLRMGEGWECGIENLEQILKRNK